MGARLTAFENRSSLDMEIRVLIHPCRPDQFLIIKKIRPGQVKELVTKSLVFFKDTDPEDPPILMVMLGTKFTVLDPLDLVKFAKIICDIDEAGLLKVRYLRVRFPAGLRNLRGFSFCLGRKK